MDILVRKQTSKRIEVDPTKITYKEIMEKYGVSKQTACLGRKRGWFIVRKKRMNIPEDFSKFDSDEAYRIAHIVFFKEILPFYGDKTMDYVDDLQQEAVIRMLELSGNKITNAFGYYYNIAKYEMLNALHRYGLRGIWSKNICSYEAIQEIKNMEEQ